MTVFMRRLEKLEEKLAPKPYPRVHCFIVREGHEMEDEAAYFAEKGIAHDPNDLSILRIIIGGPNSTTGKSSLAPNPHSSD